MSSYHCYYCGFSTSLKANYERHLKTTKHLKNVKDPKKQPRKTTKNNEKTTIPSEKKNIESYHYQCKYCKKEFKYRNSMYHHIKYTCYENKDEDLKELIRLMNLQMSQKDEQLERQRKQMDKLMDKLQVNNHITNNIVQNNHIQLLSYKDTDTSHLTPDDYIQSLKKVTYCVKTLIEKIHFNPIKPENMNIYISNIKDKYLMVYEDGNWILKQKDKEIDDLYDNKEMLLEDWISEYQHQYPELRVKFNKYLNNKENDETMNAIKEEIKLMLYNKKNMLEY